MNNQMKVLISDDDKGFTSQLSTVLQKYGFETVVVPKNGTLVLESIVKYQPAVVLMDHFMSHLDAIGVMKQSEQLGL